MDEKRFDSDTLAFLKKVFEDACSHLPARREVARSLLAERILKAAASGERDPVRLRNGALAGILPDPSDGPFREVNIVERPSTRAGMNIKNHETLLNSAQSRAARGLLDRSQQKLAGLPHLSESTVRNFENERRTPGLNNRTAIQRALKPAGVEFINGGRRGVQLPGKPSPSGSATQARRVGQERMMTKSNLIEADKAEIKRREVSKARGEDRSIEVNTFGETGGNGEGNVRSESIETQKIGEAKLYHMPRLHRRC
jgi:DNA-binding XRE family transcriptional regulator